MTDPQCITDEVERTALTPIMDDLIRLLCGPVKAERWLDAIKGGAIVRRSTLQYRDVDLVALARYVRGRETAGFDAQEHAPIEDALRILKEVGL